MQHKQHGDDCNSRPSLEFLWVFQKHDSKCDNANNNKYCRNKSDTQDLQIRHIVEYLICVRVQQKTVEWQKHAWRASELFDRRKHVEKVVRKLEVESKCSCNHLQVVCHDSHENWNVAVFFLLNVHTKHNQKHYLQKHDDQKY